MTLYQLVVLAGMAEILALAAVLIALGLPGREGKRLRLGLPPRRSGRQAQPGRVPGIAPGPVAPARPAVGPPATAPPGPAATPHA